MRQHRLRPTFKTALGRDGITKHPEQHRSSLHKHSTAAQPERNHKTYDTKIDQILQAVGEDPHIESILIVVEVNYLSDFYSYKARGSAIHEISELILNASAKIGKPIFIIIMQLPDNREDY
jgi:hypothetical protein